MCFAQLSEYKHMLQNLPVPSFLKWLQLSNSGEAMASSCIHKEIKTCPPPPTHTQSLLTLLSLVYFQASQTFLTDYMAPGTILLIQLSLVQYEQTDVVQFSVQQSSPSIQSSNPVHQSSPAIQSIIQSSDLIRPKLYKF